MFEKFGQHQPFLTARLNAIGFEKRADPAL